MWTTCVPSTRRGQKMVSDPLELELQMVWAALWVQWTKPGSFCKSSKYAFLPSHPSHSSIIFTTHFRVNHFLGNNLSHSQKFIPVLLWTILSTLEYSSDFKLWKFGLLLALFLCMCVCLCVYVSCHSVFVSMCLSVFVSMCVSACLCKAEDYLWESVLSTVCDLRLTLRSEGLATRTSPH